MQRRLSPTRDGRLESTPSGMKRKASHLVACRSINTRYKQPLTHSGEYSRSGVEQTLQRDLARQLVQLYVYSLVDPLDDSTTYVGKATGVRLLPRVTRYFPRGILYLCLKDYVLLINRLLPARDKRANLLPVGAPLVPTKGKPIEAPIYPFSIAD